MARLIDADEFLRAAVLSKEFTDGEILILKDIVSKVKTIKPNGYIVTEQGDIPIYKTEVKEDGRSIEV